MLSAAWKTPLEGLSMRVSSAERQVEDVQHSIGSMRAAIAALERRAADEALPFVSSQVSSQRHTPTAYGDSDAKTEARLMALEEKLSNSKARVVPHAGPPPPTAPVRSCWQDGNRPDNASVASAEPEATGAGQAVGR